MKNLIVTTSMVIFILIVTGWQLELRGMVFQKQRFQYAAEEAAAAVAVFVRQQNRDEEGNAAADLPAAVRTAEESLRLQMSGAGGPMADGERVSVEVIFEQKGRAGMAAVVIVRKGKLAASGWYPVS